MSKTRLYYVSTPKGVRLVRAISAASALKHVVDPDYTVSVANTEGVADAMQQGVKVEDVKEAA